MKFAFLGYHCESNWTGMSKSEQDAMIDDCFAYDVKLRKAGHMLNDGAALQPSTTAKILRWHNGKVIVTDGPFAETKEQLGGVGLLEAVDMPQAVELLSRHPALHYGSTFEIRPIDEETVRRVETAQAASRASAPAADSAAQPFASLGYIDETAGTSKSPADFEAMIKQCIAFDEARIQRGQWQAGIKLQSGRSAKTVRAKEGRVVVTDGPFAETKECLGGIVVLGFANLNEAVRILTEHPALPFGVAIEIRPIAEEINRRWEEMQGN